ncbi:MAG: redox-regulated ATPase YchF [Pseudomonadota bacterium]|nr:redox-regulated ATPase YchF [Pseudomonadota bacterium]
MGFNCGIIGLPNVGKSTLFNALTSTVAAQTANYPFCTIEPNSGRVSVPDSRLSAIAKIAASEKMVPTYLEFVDIAGLVRGASTGEGLGNQFLANIREVDAIVHVLRCFTSETVTHVETNIDPVRDAEIVETELKLADLASLEKRIEPLEKKSKAGDKIATHELETIEPLFKALSDGIAARDVIIEEEKLEKAKQLNLLTLKPVLYVCNVEEGAASCGNKYSEEVFAYAAKQSCTSIVISAQIEAELSLLEEGEKNDFLDSLGLLETGLSRLIRAGYSILELKTYFTAGPNETRAWTIEKVTRAQEAAGRIHSDFERGFICAETISNVDYLALGGESAAKAAGKMRQEGGDYIIQEGDVVLYRFNVS